MKKFFAIVVFMFVAQFGYSQTYDDLFTVYKSVPTPAPCVPNRSKSTIEVPRMSLPSTSSALVQTVKGVNIKNGKPRIIKMKVGLDTVLEKVEVLSVWNGHTWRTFEFLYASGIKNNAPEEIKQLYDFQVNVPGIGVVYF